MLSSIAEEAHNFHFSGDGSYFSWVALLFLNAEGGGGCGPYPLFALYPSIQIPFSNIAAQSCNVHYTQLLTDVMFLKNGCPQL